MKDEAEVCVEAPGSPAHVGPVGGDAADKDKEPGSTSRAAASPSRSWCENRASRRCKACGAALALYLVAVLLLNLLCQASVRSPFYSVAAGLETVAGILLAVAALLALTAWWFRAELRGAASAARRGGPGRPARPSRRSWACAACAVAAYLAVSLCVFFAAKVAVYPGLLELAWEVRPEGLKGEEFVFASAQDGASLHGYRAVFSADSYGLTASRGARRVVPVLMLGGNGETGWSSVFAGERFVRLAYGADEDLAFDVFSFSYRGYAPNDRFSILETRESLMIEDSASLFAVVRARYPGQRVMVFAHSMGTGPTSALLARLSGAELACVGLGMPYASLRQASLEVAWYAPTPWAWTIDSFRSEERVPAMDAEVPLLVLSGGRDELIAPHHQRTIFERAASRRKELFFAPDASHVAIWATISAHRDSYAAFFNDTCLARAGA